MENKLYDNSEVRRQDRLLCEEAAMELLREGEYGFLALGGEAGYGVPMSYVWDGVSVWFHCAPEGEKLRRIEACAGASFCVVGPTEVQPAKFTTLYRSVIVAGRIEIVAAREQRIEALRLLSAKYSPEFAAVAEKYIAASLARTAVLKLTPERITGKTKSAAPHPKV